MRYLKLFANLLVNSVVIYLLICLIMFVSQRSLIYYPQPSLLNTPATTLKLPIAEGELQVSVRQLNSPKALIYFGGNAEDVSQNLPEFSKNFPDYAIYLLHYRGYGHSSGEPSEEAIQQDALLLFDLVYRKHRDITVIGRSLGSGVAVQVASQRPVSKLVLITPYNSLEEVAEFNYPYIPINLLLLDKYESWRYAPQIAIPTLILAAEHDEVIPNIHAKKLSTSFNLRVVSYQILPDTNHNSITQSPQYLGILQGFMKMSVR